MSTNDNIATLTVGSRHMTVDMVALLADAFDISKSAARRFLQAGAVRINGHKWQHFTGCRADVDDQVVQIGKRQFVRIVCT